MPKRRPMNSSPLVAVASTFALTSAAFAQQPGVPAGPAAQPYSATGAAASQSGAARSGGLSLKLMDMLITVHPSLRVDVQHNDNIYSAANNRTSDLILVLIPALQLETRQAGKTYRLRLSTTLGQHQKNRADNYTNTNLNGMADFDLGMRLHARAEADYLDGVDPRGSTNNPLSSTPDHYRQIRGQGVVTYGAPGALGRLELELGQVRREYLNNRASTASNDRVTDELGATFHWRVGPKTMFLVQGKHSKVDYPLSTSTLGSVENALLAGATWEATAKTSGTFRFGMTKKDFDVAARASSTTVTWAGQIRWSPRSYSHVDFTLNRAPAETTGGVGNFIDRTSTGARWTHDWSSRLTSDASASYATEAYQGVTRTDNTLTFGFGASYKMRRWLNFGANYAHTMRKSEDSNFDYKRNVLMLFVNAAL